MLTNHINFWGAVVLLIIVASAMALVYLADRRQSMRQWRALFMGTLQIAALGVTTWIVLYIGSWWADVAWLLAMAVAMSLLLLRRLHLGDARLLLVMSGILLATVGVVGSCILWTLASDHPFTCHHQFVAVSAVLMGHLYFALHRGLHTYTCSLRRTTEHRLYLLANGATHVEAVMPSVRRALRASLVPLLRGITAPGAMLAVPLLFCGLLMCGVAPLMAAIVVWLLMASCLAATAITVILLVWLADRWLSAAQG